MYKFLIAGLLLTSAAVYFATSSDSLSLQAAESEYLFLEFQDWQAKYNKLNTNSNDDLYRFGVWMLNREYIQQSGDSTLGLNVLADLTNEEYQQRYLSQRPVSYENLDEIEEISTNYTAPSSVDWVAKGGVTPVQNQGNCGGCWAFGSVGGLEGLWFATTGNLVKMSEQQLVSCDPINSGCGGGLEMIAYGYTAKHGIQTEKSYPYTSGVSGEDGACKYNADDVVFKNKSFKKAIKNDINSISSLVADYPVAKGISASSIVFQLYNGGVFKSESCGTNMDHSVTMVGYDDNASTPYWTIKNSWGTGWGEQGFMQIRKGDNGKDGVCGINMDTIAPTL